MKELKAIIKENEPIAENIYKLTVELSEDAGKIGGGQFLNISTGDNSRLLKRPLGIVEHNGRLITVCYQVKGEGTQNLSHLKTGESLNVLLPLGNGFKLEKYKNVAVIGGGVGIFPLIATIKEYEKDINFYSYIGFRNKSAVCLLDSFKTCKKLTVTSDDGSYGIKGNAVSAFLQDYKNIKADAIIACGPPVMLKALKNALSEHKITLPCFVSLEERMGCGIGACLVCVCKKSDGGNARVCKDGPVFNINEVEL